MATGKLACFLVSHVRIYCLLIALWLDGAAILVRKFIGYAICSGGVTRRRQLDYEAGCCDPEPCRWLRANYQADGDNKFEWMVPTMRILRQTHTPPQSWPPPALIVDLNSRDMRILDLIDNDDDWNNEFNLNAEMFCIIMNSAKRFRRLDYFV